MKLISLSTPLARKQLEIITPESLTTLDVTVQWAPELFLETAMMYGVILNETDWASIMGAGKSALRSAVMPGLPEDLGPILKLLNPLMPEADTLKIIANLTKTASNNQGDLLLDKNWWGQLFRLFKADQALQAEVIALVGRESEATKPQQPQPNQSNQPNQQQPASQPGPSTPNQPQPTGPTPPAQQSVSHQLLSQLRGLHQKGHRHMQHLNSLRAQGQSLRRRFSEGCNTVIARLLTEEPVVIAKIGCLMRETLQRIGVAPHSLTEAQWFDRLARATKAGVGGLVNQARTHFSTPQYGSYQLQQASQQKNNKVLATLAVRMLTDKTRHSLQQSLGKVNHSVESAHKLMQHTTRMILAHHQQQLPPAKKPLLMRAVKEMAKILSTLHKRDVVKAYILTPN